MSTSVSSILNGAFGLVRRYPKAVAAWACIYLAVTVGSALFWMPIQARLLSAAPNARMGFQDVAPILIGADLFGIGAIVVQMVLITAAYRAVLRPEQSGFAFLRFGMDEIRQIVLAIAMIVGFYVLLLAGFLAIMFGIGFMSAAGTAGAVLGIILGILLGIAFACFCIWLAVRLCLAFPLMVLRRSFAIGEAWRLSRGYFWPLFGAFIVVAVLYFVCAVVISSFTSASYMAALMSSGAFEPGGKGEAVRQAAMIRDMTAIGPMTVIGWIFGGLVGGIFVALNGGATATAVRDLAVDDQELIRQFS